MAVAQLVEPLVVVQVVVGSSPISHLRLSPRGRALPGLAHVGCLGPTVCDGLRRSGLRPRPTGGRCRATDAGGADRHVEPRAAAQQGNRRGVRCGVQRDSAREHDRGQARHDRRICRVARPCVLAPLRRRVARVSVRRLRQKTANRTWAAPTRSGLRGGYPPPQGPVAQRIERRTSNPCAEVRLLPGPSFGAEGTSAAAHKPLPRDGRARNRDSSQ